MDEKTLENLAEFMYKLFIMRHKIKMIWFLVNKEDDAPDAASNIDSEEETKKEELTEEQE